jgi:ribosomal protein S12 methylthiotransferase accessory factor
LTQTEVNDAEPALPWNDDGEAPVPASRTAPIGDRLAALVSPFGLVPRVRRLQNPAGEPAIAVFAASVGNLDMALGEIRRLPAPRSPAPMTGVGSSLDQATARWLSVAECVERYSASVYTPAQFLWATAEELGADALDLDRCPRVSRTEAASPHCHVMVPDKHSAIRWVRGLSLMTGREIWVPAILAFLQLAPASVGERFTLPISTGCAAHSDLRQALCSAICEVAERDAMALTWLQRLPLPPIEIGDAAGGLPVYQRFAECSQIRTYLFDATTDIGIPVVYAVQVTPSHPELRTVVTAASTADPRQAIEKVLCELAACRIGLLLNESGESDPDRFHRIFDGARYMAAPDRTSAFDFLLADREATPLASMPSCAADRSAQTLGLLLSKLSAAGHEAFAVDLTTDESERAGLSVVRVIVPTLQPLTFAPRTQFRAHPRLYQAAAAMGYPVHPEADLNPWPQPAA